MDRDAILIRLRERIVAFAASRIGRQDAEDLAQDVLVVIEQKYADLDSLSDLLPLSLQIMRFQMAARHRKLVRRGGAGVIPVEDVPLPAPDPDPEESASKREMHDRLSRCLHLIGPRCRDIFRLKLEGKTFAEIQQEVGAGSINTVYTWDARCRKRLLDLMGGAWEKQP